MIKKHEIKSLIIIALPLMAAFLAERGMEFIDTIMMGWIGPTALAAGAIGTTIFGTTILFCMGVLSSVGVFIVRAKGADNISDIKFTMQHGFCLALLLSVPGMLIIWFIPHVLLSLGEDPQVVINTSLLLHGMVWGFPGFLLFLLMREFTSAFSLTLVVMVVSLISIPLTFMANYILIYGKYHFPELRIAGIGYGGSIVMWFMFISMLIYSKRHPLLNIHFGLRPFRFDQVKFRDMLYIGIPSGGLFLLEASMFLSTTILMGYFGVAALAAHQIALLCVNIAYTLPVSFSIATALQVGLASGSKNFTQAQRVAFVSFCMVFLIAALIAIIFIFFSNYIAILFLKKGTENFEGVYQFATTFIKIAALFLCFDALQSVANGALRGLKDTFVPMLLSIGCYWALGIGGAYYLSTYTYLGARGIWYGLTLGLCSSATLLVFRFFKKIRVEKIRFRGIGKSH